MTLTRTLLHAALAAAPLALTAQAPVQLTLGGAARLAASQSGASAIARTRVDQAEARIRQARSALLPTISASASENERNQNTATFGFSFRDPTGTPLFDPNGQILPAFKVLDLRARAQANLVDFSVAAKLGAVRQQARVAAADAAGAGDQAAAQAAAAYVRAVRADAVLGARMADSTLAAELLGIAEDQLKAGVGVALDVTRARSQLSAAHAQLIAARVERDRARLDLRRIINVAPTAELVLTDSLMALPVTGAFPSADEGTRIAFARRADLRAAAELQASAPRSSSACQRSACSATRARLASRPRTCSTPTSGACRSQCRCLTGSVAKDASRSNGRRCARRMCGVATSRRRPPSRYAPHCSI